MAEIANNIEVVYFKQFLSSMHIFACEEYGKPVYEKFKHHQKDIEEFGKRNPLMTKPSDLIPWCTLYMIDKVMLILKNISIEAIVDKLRKTYSDIYIMYTPENSSELYIRVYYRGVMFKKEVDLVTMKATCAKMNDLAIRGVSGCVSTKVINTNRSEIKSDGSIGRIKDLYAVTTVGTNLAEALMNPYVDPYNSHTDAVQEMFELFGIESAGIAIIQSLRNISPNINHRHYQQYAREMTKTGFVTPIEISGVKEREGENILLRIGFSHINSAIEDASIKALNSNVYGVSGPLLLGDTPRSGTLYNQFIVDEEFVRSNTKSWDAMLSEL
jgi:hypothetical protein